MRKYVFIIVCILIIACKKNISDSTVVKPKADFSADQTNITAGSTINFTDLSSGVPFNWSWTFEGGRPETSTSQNPNVEYTNTGTYNVTLSVGNEKGNNIKTKTAYITVVNNPRLPSVTTVSVNNINATSVQASGNITNQGDSPVTERGLCWKTSPNPTIANSNSQDGNDIGSFTRNILDLTKKTTYYLRAYATNSYGTAYGNELTFTTSASFKNCGTVTDIDGNVYNTVTIGTQCWMMENLKTTRFKNGTPIPKVQSGWYNLPTPAYCYYMGDSTNNNSTYGKLYNYFAVKTGNLAPAGWHIPNDAEWNILLNYLIGQVDIGVGNRMKATTLWRNNTEPNNSSGFTALPSGFRRLSYSDLSSVDFGKAENCAFWSTTFYSSPPIGRSSAFSLYYSNGLINPLTDYISEGVGYSVRCVKD